MDNPDPQIDIFTSYRRKRIDSFFREKVSIEPMTGVPFDERKLLIIAFTPRSGSTYLSSVLEQNGVAQTDEHFRHVRGFFENDLKASGARTYEDYFRYKIDLHTSDEGTFCTKCDFPQFMPLLAYGAYDHYLRNAKWVYLTRNDVLGQAISRYIATESGYFHTSESSQEDREKIFEVRYDFEKINKHLDRILEIENDWKKFFMLSRISPYKLSYEELKKNPKDSITRLFEYFGVNNKGQIETETSVRPVRTQKNRLFRKHFLEEAPRHWGLR